MCRRARRWRRLRGRLQASGHAARRVLADRPADRSLQALRTRPRRHHLGGAFAGGGVMTLEEAYERMLVIRRFEEEIERLFLRGKVHGTTHLCIGQEAVAVGIAAALRDDDLLAATYR